LTLDDDTILLTLEDDFDLLAEDEEATFLLEDETLPTLEDDFTLELLDTSVGSDVESLGPQELSSPQAARSIATAPIATMRPQKHFFKHINFPSEIITNYNIKKSPKGNKKCFMDSIGPLGLQNDNNARH